MDHFFFITSNILNSHTTDLWWTGPTDWWLGPCWSLSLSLTSSVFSCNWSSFCSGFAELTMWGPSDQGRQSRLQIDQLRLSQLKDKNNSDDSWVQLESPNSEKRKKQRRVPTSQLRDAPFNLSETQSFSFVSNADNQNFYKKSFVSVSRYWVSMWWVEPFRCGLTTCPTSSLPPPPATPTGSRWRLRASCPHTQSSAPGRGSTTSTTNWVRGATSTTTLPPPPCLSPTCQWTTSPACPLSPPCPPLSPLCPTTLSAGQYYSTDFITQRNLYLELLMMTISILLIFIHPTKKLRASDFIWIDVQSVLIISSRSSGNKNNFPYIQTTVVIQESQQPPELQLLPPGSQDHQLPHDGQPVQHDPLCAHSSVSTGRLQQREGKSPHNYRHNPCRSSNVRSRLLKTFNTTKMSFLKFYIFVVKWLITFKIFRKNTWDFTENASCSPQVDMEQQTNGNLTKTTSYFLPQARLLYFLWSLKQNSASCQMTRSENVGKQGR